MGELTDSPDVRPWLVRRRHLMLIAGPVIVIAVALYFYLTGGRIVSTDDAFIQSARTDISSNVSGPIAMVLVKDNQPVKKGEVLFTLDERPFRIAVAEAQAQLAGARLRIEAMKATYQQRLADRQAAQDLLAYRQTELQRQQRLAAAGISSRAQLDQALHEADAARQQLAASRESIANIMADLGGTADVPIEQHPSLRQAQAQLDRALLNLSYTTIKAPTDGIATKVEQIQAGDYITASTPVFALMSNSDIWVEANFKETDLTHMRIGQRAEITIDSYPDRVFDGQLISLSPGTGSSFSLLPPENATGNWVKVVQRLAVRIAFDPLPADVPLRAGLSVTVHVDTQHHRTLFGGKAPSP